MSNPPIKFLLVDDLDANLLVLEGLLRREGLELLKARSGSEALELLLVHDVALALLDVQMPEMGGFELAEHGSAAAVSWLRSRGGRLYL
jgi:CheY-like chemotaxis protein